MSDESYENLLRCAWEHAEAAMGERERDERTRARLVRDLMLGSARLSQQAAERAVDAAMAELMRNRVAER